MADYEDTIVCDLAETYNLYDFENIEGRKLATYVLGLRPSSRLMMELNGMKATTQEILTAKCVDTLNMLLWSKTNNAKSGRNKPESIVKNLMVDKKPKQGFENSKDFERALKEKKERAIKNGRQ